MSETRTLFALNEEENITAVFTPFSLIHAFSGWYMALLFNYIGLNKLQGFTALNLVHLLYELKDYYITYHTEKGKTDTTYKNTITNSVGDQVSAIIGALIFYSMNKGKVVTINKLLISTISLLLVSVFAWSIAWGYFRLG
jgi:hypothetical protein